MKCWVIVRICSDRIWDPIILSNFKWIWWLLKEILQYSHSFIWWIRKKYTNYSKCVHLQGTSKFQLLGVPYPWPGATKFNLSIFALGLWGRQYWSKMEVLVTYSQTQWTLLQGPGNYLMYMRKQRREAEEFHRVGGITGYDIACLGLGESVSCRSWQVGEYTNECNKKAWK